MKINYKVIDERLRYASPMFQDLVRRYVKHIEEEKKSSLEVDENEPIN